MERASGVLPTPGLSQMESHVEQKIAVAKDRF